MQLLCCVPQDILHCYHPPRRRHSQLFSFSVRPQLNITQRPPLSHDHTMLTFFFIYYNIL